MARLLVFGALALLCGSLALAQSPSVYGPGSPPITASPTFGFNGSPGAFVGINAAPSTNRYVQSYSNNAARWSLVLGNNTNETGSNVGSDFQVSNENDAGAVLASPFTIQRSSGHIILSSTPGVAVASGAGDCGTSPAIAGSDNNGRVTVGSSTNGAHCTVTFAFAWSNAPTCAVWNETSGARGVFPASSTATLVITATSTLTAADKLGYSCVGY